MKAIGRSFLSMMVLFVGSFLVALPVNADATPLLEQANIYDAFVYENGEIEISAEEGDLTQADIAYDAYENWSHKQNEDVLKPKSAEFYRADSKDGAYNLVGIEDYFGENEFVRYTDFSTVIGNTYYYKVRLLAEVNGQVIYSEWSKPFRITCVPSPNPIKHVRATNARTFTITWSPVTNVDGYELYLKEFPNKYIFMLNQYSVYEVEGTKKFVSIPEYVENLEYQKVAEISDASISSYKYKKAKHGYEYLVGIRTFKNINGNKLYSTIMYHAHGVMDYYFCTNAENTKYNYKSPRNKKSAQKLMKTVRVKVWDYKDHAKHSGKKITRYRKITVNKKYADTIVQIYKEIYKSKEKPPIYEIKAYRWEKGRSSVVDMAWLDHTEGIAIDMNCKENPAYTYSGKKKRMIAGSFYKPKTNPYSIPKNGVIEKTFAKYGFIRSHYDLMCFYADDYMWDSSNYE